MIKDALEAGVPGIKDVVAIFTNQRFAAFYALPTITMPSQDFY
jgi:hypothetical protein